MKISLRDMDGLKRIRRQRGANYRRLGTDNRIFHYQRLTDDWQHRFWLRSAEDAGQESPSEYGFRRDRIE